VEERNNVFENDLAEFVYMRLIPVGMMVNNVGKNGKKLSKE